MAKPLSKALFKFRPIHSSIYSYSTTPLPRSNIKQDPEWARPGAGWLAIGVGPILATLLPLLA
eukprot:scaffold60479_cov27-Tisochrysis_lutea.AAC.1